MTNSVHSARYQKLCSLLVEARKSKGLSQEALAQTLGRVQTFVSKYERGERRLDVVEFLEVAAALDLDVRNVLRQIQNLDG
jgi:transcriptional regulator with XRE-family HTH domain